MPAANTSNISTIQILRSYANSAPSTLADGQLAFSFLSNTLFIGSNTGGVIAISDQATANLARSLANTIIGVQGVDVSQNARMAIIENVDASQNVRLDYSNTAITIIQGVDLGQNTAIAATDGKMSSAYNQANTGTVLAQAGYNQSNASFLAVNSAITIIQGTDVGQNNRMAISDNVNASQNVRLDYSNTAITIIQGVDVGQNSRMTIIEGTNTSQNVRIDYSNTAIGIIQGVDVTQNTAIAATDGKMQSAYNQANTAQVKTDAAYVQANVTIGVDTSQNTRMTIIEGTNVSQNVRLDYSNAVITIIQGVDVTQNTRLLVIENTDLSQNVSISTQNNFITVIQGVDVGQNSRMTIIEGTDVTQNTAIAATDGKMASAYNQANTGTVLAQASYNQSNASFLGVNTAITIIQGTDVTQNTRLTVIEGTDSSQNVRLDYSNTTIGIIQGVDVGQNARMTIIEGTDVSQNARMAISDGVDASQNVRLDYSNTAITIIQGTDVGQNARMTIIEGADASQNVRLDYSNAAITIIQGVDVGQNTRLTVIENTDLSQNVRLDYSNSTITIIQGVDISQNARMAIIEGVDVTQNTNIANKLNLTGSLNQTVSGNVTISQDLIVAGNLVLTGNINSQNVQQLAVADPLIVLGIGNYVSDTKDIGFAGHYNDGTNAHAGFIRDAGTKEFYVFQGYTPELDSNNNVIITDPTFKTANLNASYFKGNLIATTAVVNGIDLSTYTQATYAQANVTIGVDTTQNTRMSVIEGTDASQNTRLDYSNAAITIIQGTDVSQNARMTIIEGTDVGQNTRLTVIEGTDVSQNANITLLQAYVNAANANITSLYITANNALPNTGTLVTVNSLSRLYVSNTTTSTSNTTGALVVGGGLGVSGNVYVSNTLSVLIDSNGLMNRPLNIQGGVAGSYGARLGVVNESFDYYTQGGYSHFFATNGPRNAIQFAINNTAAAVNYLTATGSTTGNYVTIGAAGSDANNNIRLQSGNGGAIDIYRAYSSTNVSRVEIGAIGGATGDASGGAFWRGLHMYAPNFTVGGTVNSFPRSSHYFEFSSMADPTYRNYYHALGNASAGNNYTFIFSNNTGGWFDFKSATSNSTDNSFRILPANTFAGITHTQFLQVTGAVTSNTPIMSSQGTDANPSMAFIPKGTGAFDVQTANVNFSNGNTITSIYQQNGGSPYTSTPTVTISNPTTAGGTVATANAFMGLWGTSIVNAGSGYTVNDIITFVGGVLNTQAVQVQVLTVNGTGAILTTGVYNNQFGNYWTVPTSPISVTGGTGTAATFNSTWTVYGTTVINAGSGYIEQPTVTYSAAGGSGAVGIPYVGGAANLKTLGTNLNFYTPGGLNFRVADTGQNPTGGYWSALYSGQPTLRAQSGAGVGASIQNSGTGPLYFGTSSGITQLTVTHTASAVNYVNATGAATGSYPLISAQGNDPNIPFRLASKGTSAVQFSTNYSGSGGGNLQFAVLHTVNSINNLNVTGAATGNTPLLSATGADTNVNLGLSAQGNGAVLVNQTYNQQTINVNNILQVTGNVAANGSIVAQNIYIQGGSNYVQNSANLQASFVNHAGDVANTTITANNTIVAPDGTYTAWQLNNNGNQTTPTFGIYQLISTLPGTNGPFTASVWMRAGSLTSAQFFMSGASDDTVNVGGLFTLTNQWQRFVITGVTTTSTQARIQISTNAQAGNILVWGPQIELASPLTPKGVASPYVPTYGFYSVISANNNLYVPTGNVAANNMITANRMSWANANAAIMVSQIYNSSTNSLDVVFG